MTPQALRSLIAGFACCVWTAGLPGQTGTSFDVPTPTPGSEVRAEVFFSTYLGGAAGNPDDSISAIDVDLTGHLLVAGTTDARDFPTTPGALQATCSLGPLGGCRDIFVAKFSSDGSPIFSTYLGSAGNDEAGGIVADSAGNIYVTGAWDGGTAFVAKLDPNGKFLYRRDFPRTAGAAGRAIAVDRDGNVYIAGEVFVSSPPSPFNSWPSSGFLAAPRTPSCFAIGGGAFFVDVFVAKIDDQGALVFDVALGGNGNDFATGVAVDDSGAVWLTGRTSSSDFPLMQPVRNTFSGSTEPVPAGSCDGDDGFLAKIDPSGRNLLYSTFLGSAGRALDIDFEGNVYLLGRGGLDPLLHPGCLAVTKYDPSGRLSLYSTCLDGVTPQGMAIDRLGNAFVTGFAGSDASLSNQSPGSTSGGGQDAFLAKLDFRGRLRSLSYFGGSGLDAGKAVAAGSNGAVFIAGATDSSDFPGLNPFQPQCAVDFRGGCSIDGFITGIKLQDPDAAAVVSGASFSLDSPLTANSIASLFGAGLAEGVQAAQSLPLPTFLAGTSILVRDLAGAVHEAGLFYVSPRQINFLIPPLVSPGPAVASVVLNGQITGRATLNIQQVSPAIFSADASGTGPAAALVVAGDSQEAAPTFRCLPPAGCAAIDIDLAGEPSYLVLFATGVRGHSGLQDVVARVGNRQVPVVYAGPHSLFAGLDQVNLGPLPKSLAGSGAVEVHLAVAGLVSNRVDVAFK